jgi:hypothetical protein
MCGPGGGRTVLAMASSRTLSTTVAAVAGSAVLAALVGCDPISFRQLDFTDTEAVTIETVTILPGAGDVVVRSSTRSDVQVKRVVRYQGAEPQADYRIEGTELILDTSCGRQCSVSYTVAAPAGVAVRGENGSGDLDLHRVGGVQVDVGSGDIAVSSPTGPVRVGTGSGSVEVSNAPAGVTMRTGSGDVTGRAIGGTVQAESGSGDVTVDLAAPASVRAHASSGTVRLTVPTAAYRVRSSTGSGDADLRVADDPSATFLLDLETGSGDIVLIRR